MVFMSGTVEYWGIYIAAAAVKKLRCVLSDFTLLKNLLQSHWDFFFPFSQAEVTCSSCTIHEQGSFSSRPLFNERGVSGLQLQSRRSWIIKDRSGFAFEPKHWRGIPQILKGYIWFHNIHRTGGLLHELYFYLGSICRCTSVPSCLLLWASLRFLFFSLILMKV